MDKSSESTLVKPASSYDALAARFQCDHQASRYHSELSFRQRLRVVQEMVGQPEGQLILDAGCGSGLYSESLAIRNTVAGLDFSYEMGRVASRKKIHSVHGDLQTLPFRPDSFDIVLLIEVLQHFGDPGPILTNLAAVVRPGGRLIIASLHPSSLLHFLYRPFGAYTDLCFHSAHKVRETLLNLNLDIQEVRLLSYPLGWQWAYVAGWGNPFSFMGSSWILSAIKK